MDSIIQADIFFFVTTIFVALMAVIFVIAAVYVVRILKDVRYISDLAHKQADLIAKDVEELREKMKRESTIPAFFTTIARLFNGREKKVERRKQRNEAK